MRRIHGACILIGVADPELRFVILAVTIQLVRLSGKYPTKCGVPFRSW